MNKMSLFALSVMAMVLSCSEKGPFDYPSQRDLEDMAAMSSSSEGVQVSSSSGEEGSSSSIGEQSSSSEEVSSSSSEGGSSSSTGEQSSSSEEASSSSSEEGSSSSLSSCGNYNEENEFCRNNYVYEKCGDKDGIGKSEYDPAYYFCRNNYLFAKCGGKEYNPPDEVCNGGIVGKLCGSTWFNPETHFCLSGTTPTPLCGEEEYTGSQFCRSGVVYNKCNGNEYEPTHFCSGNTILVKCGGAVEYNPVTEQCCGSGKYTLASQFCSGGAIYDKCGSIDYNLSAQFCLDDAVTSLCGGLTHTNSQFCSAGTVYEKCGGTVLFTPETEACCGNNEYTLSTHYCRTADNTTHSCGGKPLNPDTQFCYDNSKVGNYCGTRSETFDPDLYECFTDNIGGVNMIFLKMYVDYGGEAYDAVLIGSQTWLARNLNYNANGSKCYGDSQDICYIYGRLYNWETAMAGSSSSTTVPSGLRGVCPSGWHLPSTAEWDMLRAAVGGDNTAGTKLKAGAGWNNNGNGTNDYGFSALPGGNGYGDSFERVGNYGFWWSSTKSENENYLNEAYDQIMSHNSERAYQSSADRSALLSVRCVKD